MKIIIVSLCVLVSFTSLSQAKKYDLKSYYTDKKLSVVNRTASLEDNHVVISEADDGEGIAWLKDVTFANGTIEIDLRGQDVLQKSFLGIAFHGTDDATYDAIYFRPFNFHATDPVRKIHAVQYISHPTYTWKKLRDEKNGIYEKALVNPPDPNGWFHARIVVAGENISVFVNDDKAPSLTVTKISTVKDGKVGLWVGSGSGGSFSNLVITRQ